MKNKVFTVVYWTGKVEFVEDLNKFAARYGYHSFWHRVGEDAALRFYQHNWEESRRYLETAHIDGCFRDLSFSFYILDSMNRIMNKDAIANYVPSLSSYLEYQSQRYSHHRWLYRRGTGTGRGKQRNYRETTLCRNVRYVASRVAEEGEPEFRGKQREIHISLWWDEEKPRFNSRSWKDCTKRKQQYKPKK